MRKKKLFHLFNISGTLLRNGPGLFEFRDQKAKFYIPSTIKNQTNCLICFWADWKISNQPTGQNYEFFDLKIQIYYR